MYLAPVVPSIEHIPLVPKHPTAMRTAYRSSCPNQISNTGRGSPLPELLLGLTAADSRALPQTSC